MANSRKINTSSAGASLVSTDVDCDSGIVVGDWVKIDGNGVAQKAQADSVSNAQLAGVVQNKSSSTKCDIVHAGPTDSIFSSLDETKTYFLSNSVAGGMTLTVPTASGSVVLKVGVPLNQTQLIVQIGERLLRA